ncbi:MAG: DUF4230 domain-containing protein [Prevotellaceae bacterium]|jgi:hypothetical protein|nr:DUF4230 domain-containing protein [Prevotellaceae bacterium]
MKSIISRIVTIVILVVAGGLFLKFSNFDIAGLFKVKPIVIDKTANVVGEIRRLAEYATGTYYYNVVIKKSKEASLFGIKMPDNELVLVITGKVRAGFDLSKLQDQDIIADSVSITVRLPKVQILDVITNPSDFETFEESGKWSHEEVTGYKNEARATLEIEAINGGILEFAKKSGKENLTSFLQALGFKNVTILLTN